jgi:hypothetical protein
MASTCTTTVAAASAAAALATVAAVLTAYADGQAACGYANTQG